MEGPRLMAKLKIAICVPVYGNPEALFLQSLASMISCFYEAHIADEHGDPYEKQIDTFVVSSSMLTEGRHRLCAEALNSGADYMLWADADHVFPADALCRLWAHGKDIVGCNYARRTTPTAPTACTKEVVDGVKGLLYTTEEKADAHVLEEVEHLGFGLCLMKMSVLDALQVQAEKEGKSTFLPLFMFEPTEDYRTMIGEDVYFFGKCRAAGLTVWCDHKLSWMVGHVSKQILTNAHAVAHREKWEVKRVGMAMKYQKRIDELEAEAA
jgi:hypothetical protein